MAETNFNISAGVLNTGQTGETVLPIVAGIPLAPETSTSVPGLDSSHTVTSGSPALSHHYTLEVNNSFHPVTVDAISWSSIYTIAPLDCMHLHTSNLYTWVFTPASILGTTTIPAIKLNANFVANKKDFTFTPKN
jgi:hypothetical protein